MNAMRYFPAFCAACQRSFLVKTDGVQQPFAQPTCVFCESIARLVPSAYYGEVDRARFESAEMVIHQARMSGGQLAALVLGLERATMTIEPQRRAAIEMFSRVSA